jgi:hypothetical protein
LGPMASTLTTRLRRTTIRCVTYVVVHITICFGRHVASSYVR